MDLTGGGIRLYVEKLAACWTIGYVIASRVLYIIYLWLLYNIMNSVGTYIGSA